MQLLDAALILVAGVGAGMINAVVGSGTLITFPTLLALGYPPVVANVSNNVGLVPGSFAAAWGYRRELAGQGSRLARFGVASALGGVAGAVLLLVLPDDAFSAIVPALIALAVVLVVVQPALTRRMTALQDRPRHGGPLLLVGILLTGIYGGYFGAAQGVLLIAVMSLGLNEELQRINGIKNFLSGLVNGVAALVFIAIADIDWAVAGLVAGGSVCGALLGAKFGRRLSARVLRGLVVAIGVVAVISLLR